jgi:hypothetical protein
MALKIRFKVVQLNRATNDLENAIDYYNSIQNKLGIKFYLEFKNAIKIIKLNPFLRVYYDNVHCLKINKFPYLLHYKIDIKNQTIIIQALICTHRNPDVYYPKSEE